MFGPDQLLLAGTVAACPVTFFTFLPTFLFILIGGPVIGTTHGELKLAAPLTAITALVVDVIVNLAPFIGLHGLWPEGWAGPFDAAAALIAAACAVALIRYKVNVSKLIACCAVAGAVKAGVL